MSFSTGQIDQLSALLNAATVKKNPKGFDYIEGWHAIAEANRIFGFDGWSREIVNLKSLHDPIQNAKENWGVSYGCTVRITVTADGVSIQRDGCGFGSGFSKDIGSAHESAIKEAETDAMKRALMTFGNQFGLALYDKDKKNVETTPDHEGYVSNASAWMREQKNADAINTAWSKELDNYLKLPVNLQNDLMIVRDEVLGKLTAKPAAVPDKWEALAKDIKAEIDDAIDSATVRDIIEGKRLADLTGHSKKAGDFLRNRAELKIGTISQGPTARRAA